MLVFNTTQVYICCENNCLLDSNCSDFYFFVYLFLKFIYDNIVAFAKAYMPSLIQCECYI